MIEIKNKLNILYLLFSVIFSIMFILLTIFGSIIIVVNFIQKYFISEYVINEYFKNLVCSCPNRPNIYISTPTEGPPTTIGLIALPPKQPIRIPDPQIPPITPITPITIRDTSLPRPPITIREPPSEYKPITIQDIKEPIRIINIPAEPIPIPTTPAYVCDII
jgi:hypothetical protein